MGRVEALCVSESKGCRKQSVPAAVFLTDHGIQGDAHAGHGHRQVSLLAAEDIASVRSRLPEVGPGDFAENAVVSGVHMGGLGLGSRLRLGADVVLSVTQIGKVCHTPCRIYYATGDCIMPRLGVFTRVETPGEVRTGDVVEVLHGVPREAFQAVVLTISDRCSRQEAQDTAGPAVAGCLCGSLGAHIYACEILPDERDQIAERLKHYCDGHSIDLVVTVGGTGFSPRDVTPEATRPLLDRPTPGLDEAMRAASLQRTPHAMLSRGVSGIRGSTLVINLPGSEPAAVENLQAVVPALGHGLAKLRGDASECGRPPDARLLGSRDGA